MICHLIGRGREAGVRRLWLVSGHLLTYSSRTWTKKWWWKVWGKVPSVDVMTENHVLMLYKKLYNMQNRKYYDESENHEWNGEHWSSDNNSKYMVKNKNSKDDVSCKRWCLMQRHILTKVIAKYDGETQRDKKVMTKLACLNQTSKAVSSRWRHLWNTWNLTSAAIYSFLPGTYKNRFVQSMKEKMSLCLANSERHTFSYRLYWKWSRR